MKRGDNGGLRGCWWDAVIRGRERELGRESINGVRGLKGVLRKGRRTVLLFDVTIWYWLQDGEAGKGDKDSIPETVFRASSVCHISNDIVLLPVNIIANVDERF